MDHVWSVLCTKSIIDKETNMITLFEACDALKIGQAQDELPKEIEGKQFLIGPLRLQLVTLWVRSVYDAPERGITRTVLLSPDGKKFEQPIREVDLFSSSISRLILGIDKLPYRGGGLYRFLIEQQKSKKGKWLRVATLPLMLQKETVESAAASKNQDDARKNESKKKKLKRIAKKKAKKH